MTAPSKQVIEKSLPALQKLFKAEFEENKFIVATVDQEELVPAKFRPRLGNANIPELAVEVSEMPPYSIKIVDLQGTWLFNYPR